MRPLLLFLWLFSAFGQKPDPQTFHEFAGCPTNSKCAKLTGKRRSSWLKLLEKNDNNNQAIKELNWFKKDRGVLVDIWSNTDESKKFASITWDSPCPAHKTKEKQLFYQGQLFIKGRTNQGWLVAPEQGKFITTTLFENFYLDPILVKKGKAIKSYYVPAKDIPYAMQGDSLLILREEEGQYYTLSISAKGPWSIVRTKMSNLAKTERVACPKDLKAKALLLPHPQGLYESSSCKLIKDLKTKKTYIFLSKWSCST